MRKRVEFATPAGIELILPKRLRDSKIYRETWYMKKQIKITNKNKKET